jgi:tetratricopeptide (TPR) repeat protein
MAFVRPTPFGQGPTAPQIFFGREAEVAQIVQTVTTNVGSRPARVAILGPGGYGKTTLAHAVLTVDVIREHFGDARYFVPCESVTSSGALLTELGKTLGVVNSGSNALWSRILASLTSKASIICFDNFESPWDQHIEMKHSVEELLLGVTGLHHVTVLITMRGAERPARTQWTQPFLKPLETLDHDAAEEIWQAIAGNYDEFSEKLIEAVDYVPLAIDLLSHLSQVMPPALLWKEWNSKQTKAVQTGQDHKLSNLEYSIQLSIDSGRMKANLSAKNLLGVLCILPDGLHMKQLNKFDEMLVGLDVTSCLQTLLQCSLIKLNEERFQPHPIVQHFCLNQDMLLSNHKADIETFYTTLALSESKSVSSEAYDEMVLEVHNTKATLLSLLNSNHEDESTLINASITFTRFCCSIGDHSDNVMSQAVECIHNNSSSRVLLIQSLHQLGEVYYYAFNLKKAKETMQEAERLCLIDPTANSQLYGLILRNLGNVHVQQGALIDAEVCYQKAITVFEESNYIYMQGLLCSTLGNLYRRLWKLDEAVMLYQSAIQCHKDTNTPSSQGANYWGLGWIYLLQKKLSEAEDAVQEALKFHEATNSSLQAILLQGNDYELLGRIYLELNKLEDATAACQKAVEFHKSANDALGQGNDHQILGRIQLVQGKLNEAEGSFKKALELHTMANDGLGQGKDYSWLGRIYKQQGQLHDAKAMLEKAIDLEKKAHAIASEKEDIEYLNTLLTEMEDSGT